MTDHQERIQAFVKLGEFFQGFCKYHRTTKTMNENERFLYEEFEEKVQAAQHQNGWFTPEHILFGIAEWSNLLTAKKLQDWLSSYTPSKTPPKTVALIMAGNIPLVGFHDFLCALLSGNNVLIKLSSNDALLLPFISKYLIHIGVIQSDRL